MAEPTTEELVTRLLGLLDVTPLSGDRFEGPRQIDGVGRVFGGQVIAQALIAAQATVAEDRPAHSLHAYFLRGGSEDHPVEYRVERAFDGGSFANRRITAMQQERQILSCSVSFHRREVGPHHQSEMPQVPPPEDLEPDHVVIDRHRAEIAGSAPPIVLRPRAIEMRAVRPLAVLSREPDPPEQHVWFRVRAPLTDDPALHRAVLAYWSDMRLMGTALLPHGLAFARGDVTVASLDHAVWFHEDARTDDWLLYAMDSTWSGRARGLNHGRIFTRDGRLVASVAQEGMFRPVKR
ncbi:acyl-CoA thioesterase II [Altererythrobacter soli]|uniref:Acyl-CoA thioesterase 2 n=1 Tax=Croceibacterium soli TaxID=1739690 RepID=A0A6I4UVI5_9SPHN|nr:acyl-CoA thioesterase II [Croceibacterium soli]MXP41513.1 acyl-CoA thioesterase II [Croceibacterium soli]